MIYWRTIIIALCTVLDFVDTSRTVMVIRETAAGRDAEKYMTCTLWYVILMYGTMGLFFLFMLPAAAILFIIGGVFEKLITKCIDANKNTKAVCLQCIHFLVNICIYIIAFVSYCL